MKKLLKLCSNIAHDKLLHYLYGQIIFVIITSICRTFINPFISMIIGLIISVCVLILKEIYDKHHKGTPDAKDALAGLIGVLIIIFMIFIM